MHPACRGTSCLLAWPGDQCHSRHSPLHLVHPPLVHLHTPLSAHTEQGCFPGPPGMADPTSQRPAYLLVGLTGDFIGVAQNLQLHVRLEDPAAERRETKQQVSDFQWELADPSRETLHYTQHRLTRSLVLQMGCLGVGVGKGWAAKPQQ